MSITSSIIVIIISSSSSMAIVMIDMCINSISSLYIYIYI